MNKFYSNIFPSIKLISQFIAITFALTLFAKSSAFSSSLKEITVAHPIDMAPIYSTDSKGKSVGAVIDIWRLWEKKSGIKVKFIPSKWIDILEMVKSGKIDAIAGLLYSTEREQFLDFGAENIHVHNAIFYHNSIRDIRNIKDLSPYKVGIVKKTFFESFIQNKQPNVLTASFDTFDELMNAVQKGEVKVFFRSLEGGLKKLKTLGINKDIRFAVDYTFYDKNLQLAVKKGNTELLKQINQGMALITSKEKSAIEKKHMGILTENTQDTVLISMIDRFAPFSFINAEGEPAGLLVDMWKLWSKKMDRPVAFHLSNFKGTLDALKSGKADIHASLFYSENRSKWIKFSQPFYGVGTTVFFNSNRKINSLKDLKGLKIGVTKGTYQEEYLNKNHPKIHLVTSSNSQYGVQQLRDGKIDALMSLSIFMHKYLAESGLQGKISSIQPALYLKEFRAGILKENKELLKLVDQGLNKITNLELARLEKDWIKEPTDRYFKLHKKSIRFTKAEEKWIREHKTIRLGVFNIPPYWFSNKNEYKGIFSDYLQIIENYTGINFQLINTKPLEINEFVNKKKIDAIALLRRPDAIAEMASTKAFFQEEYFIVTRNDGIFLSGMDGLKGKKVALLKGASIHKLWTQQYPEIIPYWVENSKDIIDSVLDGKADAFITTPSIINYLAIKNRIKNLKVASPAGLDSEKFRYFVRKDWPQLVSILNKVNLQISEEEHTKIRSKWVSIKIEPQVDWEMVWRWGVGIGTILGTFSLMIFLWNRRLAREINTRKEIEKELRISKEKAEAANHAKSEFISNMSHEIRTPLNAVLGFSEILEAQLSDPKYKSWVTSIQTAGKTLLNLISDILDLSKIEAGKLEIQPALMNINRCLDEIAIIFSKKIDDKGLKFIIDSSIDEIIELDELRFRQILLNLVGNAVKFTEEGFIKIGVSLKKSPDNILKIVVEDSGIGIAENQKNRIFETFSQHSGQDESKYGGTGLGLAITQKIIKQMGGQISVSSTKGQGSRFTVEIFNVEYFEDLAQDLGYESIQYENYHFPEANILIIEDIELNRELLKNYLDLDSFNILTASNGEEGIDLLKQHTVNLIITDIKMPVMDGYQVARFVRSQEDFKHIPIIAITAAQSNVDQSILTDQFDSFLTKPISKKNLFIELIKILNIQQKTITQSAEKKEDTPTIDNLMPSLEAIKTIPVILPEFESLLLKWNNRSTFSINQTIDFSKKVKTVGDTNNLLIVTQWAEELNGFASMFEVVKMKNKLSDFPNLIENLKEYYIKYSDTL